MLRKLIAFALGASAAAAFAVDRPLPPRNALTDFESLHSFDGVDGQQPDAALVVGPDGALYGTTEKGGAHGLGTVFRIGRDGQFATLHSFDGVDGAAPHGSLLAAADGRLYGTTAQGGDSTADCDPLGGCGTVYRITPPARSRACMPSRTTKAPTRARR